MTSTPTGELIDERKLFALALALSLNENEGKLRHLKTQSIVESRLESIPFNFQQKSASVVSDGTLELARLDEAREMFSYYSQGENLWLELVEIKSGEGVVTSEAFASKVGEFWTAALGVLQQRVLWSKMVNYLSWFIRELEGTNSLPTEVFSTSGAQLCGTRLVEVFLKTESESDSLTALDCLARWVKLAPLLLSQADALFQVLLTRGLSASEAPSQLTQRALLLSHRLLPMLTSKLASEVSARIQLIQLRSCPSLDAVGAALHTRHAGALRLRQRLHAELTLKNEPQGTLRFAKRNTFE